MLRELFAPQTREVHAVRNVSFDIAAGETVGFLGPNGAGKTTTLKMLSGLLKPTTGHAQVLGEVPFERPGSLLRRITLVTGQKQQLFWDLPPSDTFAYNAAVYDVPADVARKRIGELTQMLGVVAVVGKPTRQLSLGERMRCELVAALVHSPEVLFLDEPTIGLDVAMQASLRTFVRQYCATFGATLLLTSHDMQDVESLCERVIVIGAGRLYYDGPRRDLARRMRPIKRVTLVADSIPACLTNEPRVTELGDHRWSLEIEPSRLREVAGALLSDPSVKDLSVEEPRLEEIMRDLFEKELREDSQVPPA